MESAAADSDEDVDIVDELLLNRDIHEANDDNTTLVGMRKTGVPPQMADDSHSDTILFSLSNTTDFLRKNDKRAAQSFTTIESHLRMSRLNVDEYKVNDGKSTADQLYFDEKE